MQDFSQAAAFLNALGVLPGEFCNFRAIHDQDKATPAIKRGGTLEQHWSELCDLNQRGYGIFVTVAQMDGTGYEPNGRAIKDAGGDLLTNVAAIRAHYIDCDSVDAMQSVAAASQHAPAPWFWVQSSPNKGHVYWPLQARYRDNTYFDTLQRKLAQVYGGDSRIHDPTRVMRLPGFYHLKGLPHLVTCQAFPTFGVPVDTLALAQSVAHVNVIVTGGGTRKPLGTEEMAAPSLDWVEFAFRSLDPNQMSRDEWISFTAAVKQAMSTLTTPDDAFARWSAWCGRYSANDPGENLKQWNDITETQVGWKAIERKVPAIHAYRKLGSGEPPKPTPMQPQPQPQPTPQPGTVPPLPDQPHEYSGDILTGEEQAHYFREMIYVSNLGVIIDRKGRHLGSGQFNAEYGGKLFMLDEFGKTTDEAWKAATRGRLFTVPKVDHIRFLPHRPTGEVIKDELNRAGVNIYRKPNIVTEPGDIYPFLRHIELMFPIESDRAELFRYWAHALKYPGFKIPWAPFIQSAEGVGKSVIKAVMQHGTGSLYFYTPSAKDLVDSGSKFNGWMRAKLFILVDEIKVDEKRELMEVLKPMISEKELEIQSKGKDQAIEDNYSNWTFFSNFRHGMPINRNNRRIAPFFSTIQNKADIVERQMGDEYFVKLWDWLENQGGKARVVHWLMNHPVQRGEIPMRAPVTSSTEAAIEVSMGAAERVIWEAAQDEIAGFKGGWISSNAVEKRLSERGQRKVGILAIEEMCGNLGFHARGRAPRAWFQDSPDIKPYLFSRDPRADVSSFAAAQGWPE